MEIPNKSKHLIFLGAGASVSSGYPLANRLAMLMSDRRTLFEEMIRLSKDFGEEWPKEWIRNSTISRFLDGFNDSTIILKNGAFASMDELSRLSVGGTHAKHIRPLKKLMRFVFALYNPHLEHVSETDYRPLIQALFRSTSQIREDVAIISFNYDPYFEFSLRLAFLLRQRVSPQNQEEHPQLCQAITSGFDNPTDLAWLKRNGFCHLKLHGVCVFPGDPSIQRKHLPVQPNDNVPLNAYDFFAFPTVQGKLGSLVSPPFSEQEPPVILPWEIIHESGRLLSRDEFLKAVGDDWQHANLYDLFCGLWQRAREEVFFARRFSFVGLSMGPFLEPAFRYLFSGLKGRTEFIVVNPENKQFENHRNHFHPRSPRGRTHALLNKFVGEDFQFTRSAFDMDERYSESEQFELAQNEQTPQMTTYNTFADFINWELH